LASGHAPAQLKQPAEAVDPGDTRALILHTAGELFMKHGYAAVSINQIIEEVSRVRKLTKPTIYYYFADKEALFVAVLLDLLGRRGRDLAAAGATEGDLATCVAALARALPSVYGFMLTFRSAFSEITAESREKLVQARHEHLFAPLVAAFEQFAARGELRPGITPGVAATALVGLMHTLSLSDALAGTDADASALAADLLLNGIAAQEAGGPCGAPNHAQVDDRSPARRTPRRRR
jgi:AcrR family transcriptional regulator